MVANAKLIAAAPELLDVLYQCCAVLTVIDGQNPILKTIDVVIKKATL